MLRYLESEVCKRELGLKSDVGEGQTIGLRNIFLQTVMPQRGISHLQHKTVVVSYPKLGQPHNLVKHPTLRLFRAYSLKSFTKKNDYTVQVLD